MNIEVRRDTSYNFDISGKYNIGTKTHAKQKRSPTHFARKFTGRTAQISHKLRRRENRLRNLCDHRRLCRERYLKIVWSTCDLYSIPQIFTHKLFFIFFFVPAALIVFHAHTTRSKFLHQRSGWVAMLIFFDISIAICVLPVHVLAEKPSAASDLSLR